ncbi:hypothetical protein HID58_034947 [Brassica napus]|uniref:BnaA09g29960D protein n=2 Tax=Brassica napus TaxID=3708 RepID=A0A078G7P0_BRANA|nr:hypothetical protein HID58_034947 [Brassica napus]CAF2045971.1 unnamed protein product [Brassica napus]CDY21431.1 BnaA09g29960D [Brassica napus]
MCTGDDILLGQSPAEVSKAAGRFSLWDDPSALCLRRQLRQRQVLAGTNQSGCNGGYSSDRAVLACYIELVTDAETRLGNGWRSRRAEYVVVINRWSFLVRALMEGIQESQRLCKTLTCLCGHGLVRYQHHSERLIDEGFQ